jgi:hypothetical protein
MQFDSNGSTPDDRTLMFAKSKAAYQDFLTLWKNADPDIPVRRQAQAEYAKLH